MAGELYKKKILEFTRKGNIDRVKWLENIDKYVLKTHAERIARNDKTVMQELMLPSWVTWELLRDWALMKTQKKGTQCVLCDEHSEVGIEFNKKFICEYCFLKIKNLK
ncbi:MAG: hypothetical protein QXM75_01290 [Candidatus Diapherotrites archaeon]